MQLEQLMNSAFHVPHYDVPKMVGKLTMLPAVPGAEPSPVFYHEERGVPQDHIKTRSPGGWDCVLVDTLAQLTDDLHFHHFKGVPGQEGTLYVYDLKTVRSSPVATWGGRTRYFPAYEDAARFDGLFYDVPPFFVRAWRIDATGHLMLIPRHQQMRSADYRAWPRDARANAQRIEGAPVA